MIKFTTRPLFFTSTETFVVATRCVLVPRCWTYLPTVPDNTGPDRTGPDRTKSLFFGRNTGPDDILSGPVRIPDRIRDKIPDPVSSFTTTVPSHDVSGTDFTDLADRYVQ